MGYLYSHQFNEYGEDHYYAMPERSPDDKRWLAPVAHVGVAPDEEETIIRPTWERTDWESPEQYADNVVGADRIKGLYGEDSPMLQEQRERPQMFLHRPERIASVSRNPAVSPAALGTLLGVVLNKHPNVKPDFILTEAGSRLAKKGVAAGAVAPTEANPSMAPNLEEYTPITMLGRADEGGHTFDTTPLSSEDVEAGRTTMRNLVRGTKPQPPALKESMGPQFTQPKLPGMD